MISCEVFTVKNFSDNRLTERWLVNLGVYP